MTDPQCDRIVRKLYYIEVAIMFLVFAVFINTCAVMVGGLR